MTTATIKPSLDCFALSAVLWLMAGCAAHPASSSAAVTPPPQVQQAFVEKFPAVKAAEWKVKSDHNYEAEFALDGSEVAAKFDPAGHWLETERAIPPSSVPQAVQDTVARQFKDYKVVETQSVQRASEKDLIYELHLDNGSTIVKAQFSVGGAVLTQSSKPRA